MFLFAFFNSPQMREIISFISSAELQQKLFPVKVVFLFFTAVFFVAIIYFLVVSSYIKENFWYDIVEFLSWKPYGFIKIMKRWDEIKSRIEEETESEYKLAIIEADDFLNEILEKKGYKGEDFESRIEKVGKDQPLNKKEVRAAHEIRNSVVYDPDFKLDLEKAKKIIGMYERALRDLGML